MDDEEIELINKIDGNKDFRNELEEFFSLLDDVILECFPYADEYTARKAWERMWISCKEKRLKRCTQK